MSPASEPRATLKVSERSWTSSGSDGSGTVPPRQRRGARPAHRRVAFLARDGERLERRLGVEHGQRLDREQRGLLALLALLPAPAGDLLEKIGNRPVAR